ncbi:MAG: ParB/RepB/Spo0J family partition protein [Legionellales bacterium]|nr:ParB/RepB/Spo0J family partition protein [Legionellales bacterium]
MSRVKKFGVSSELQQGFSELIKAVENNEGIYRSISIPLHQVQADPTNPRDLALTPEDVKYGIAELDPLFKRKNEDLFNLQDLANSIKISGLINPIIVIKQDQNYIIVAGERRFLASLIADKEMIEARVFQTRPDTFELKLVQWFENNAREDLSLAERLENIREVINEFLRKEPNKKITADLLGNIIGLSNSQSLCYLSLIDADQDILDAIKEGIINSLDKAYLIASCKNAEYRKKAIAMCSNGISLVNLRKFLVAVKNNENHTSNIPTLKKQINLGKISEPVTIQTIVEGVINLPRYTHHKVLFSDVLWGNTKDAIKAFKKLIEIIEVQ